MAKIRGRILVNLFVCIAVVMAAPDTANTDPLYSLKLRDHHVRTKINALCGGSIYTANSPDGLRLIAPDGSTVFETESSDPYQLIYESTQSMPSFWRIAVKRYSTEDRQRAELRARKISQQTGLAARVIETPYRRGWSIASRPPGAELLVVAGKFPRPELAQQALTMFSAEDDEAPFVYFDENRAFPGYLLLRDTHGKEAARAPFESGVSAFDPSDPVYIQRAVAQGDRADAPIGYRGNIYFFQEENGFLVVNSVPLELYLQSVIPAEIGEFAPFEALKAQAVAARSEAIFKLNLVTRHYDPRFDFVSTQQDQVYSGVGEESDISTQAVRETAGEVMLYDGEPVNAVYSHSCGGITANSEDLWPGEAIPYLRSKVDYLNYPWDRNLSSGAKASQWIDARPDVYCNAHQSGFPDYAKAYFRWSKTISGSRLSNRINARGYPVGRLRQIRILERAASGRVIRVEIQGANGRYKISNGDTIRVLLGGLFSSFFTMSFQRDGTDISQVTFHGAGYGHGVGMCQMGAYMMAQRGFSCDEILNHYFTGIEIRKLY